MAYVLILVADIVIYGGIFVILRSIYRQHRLRCIAVLIFMFPFVYLLATAGSLLNILWMLVLTPLYGVIILLIVYPLRMLLYYLVAFAVLVALNLFIRNRKRKTLDIHNTSS